MELWNDFEGKTIDGRFSLEQLIGPKGRSAYFRGKDDTAAPVMIRLIESLNDEEEILARWRLVTGMKHEHLVEVLACGQTVIDGTHLVYAVMEPTDAELADVLRERALTPDETRQIALSVAGGLLALHERGLVHGHVEADNVLAKGEVVKLRSDVVREVPEGAEAPALQTRDVRDLALLIAQSLTQRRALGTTRLPVPFEELVTKGESGFWGLKEIIAALRPATAAARPLVPAQSVPPAIKLTNAPPAATPTPPSRPSAAPAPASSPSTAPAAVASRLARETGPGDGVSAHLRRPRPADRIVVRTESEPKRTGLILSIAAGVLLLVLAGIYFLRAGRAPQSRSVVQDAPSAATVPQESAENRPPTRDPASAPVAPRPAAPQPLASGSPVPRPEKPSAAFGSAHSSAANSRSTQLRSTAAAPSQTTQWRVVAFTYNREEQATQKAHALAAQHPALHPEVFTPNGRAPYLVTLGGWMSVDQASTLRNKARSEGLPRDIYTQNYRGGSR